MRAAILGLSGPDITGDERAFFRQADPLGFILFKRNCQSPAQLRRLTDSLRAMTGRADLPILIDQEGGRVARLAPPLWPRLPAMGRIGALDRAATGRGDSLTGPRAARLAGNCLGEMLAAAGITVNCAPVLDVPVAGSHDVIGDRAFASGGPDAADAASVIRLARALIDGMAESGIVPVVKHSPGHGRAEVDSHHDLPRVAASADALAARDWRPFKELSRPCWGMTAHVVYTAIDGDAPATISSTIIETVIRRKIGFDGLLMSDDISMEALGGPLDRRAALALSAGCDVVLHCSGDLREMDRLMASVTPLTVDALRRFDALKPSPVFAANGQGCHQPDRNARIQAMSADLHHVLDTLAG